MGEGGGRERGGLTQCNPPQKLFHQKMGGRDEEGGNIKGTFLKNNNKN